MAKIMLVEDDNNLRQIYEDRLAAEGYEIVSAPDGEEALALAVKERPDLIIADVMMPKVSGFDMLDILRSTPETKDCKIIMMTALSQAEDKARAEKLGADRYLVKSQVTLEDVAKIAGEILGNTGAPAAAAPVAGTATSPAAPTTATIPVSAPPASPDLVAATTTALAPDPTPVAEPVAAAPAPADPTATPAVTNIPVTAPSDDAADDKPADDTKAAAAAKEAASLAKPAEEEKAAAEKVDEFIASNPTLSASADPNKPSTNTSAETSEATPAPAETATPVPAPEPAPAPEPKPAEPEPAPVKTAPNVTITVEEPSAPATSATADPATSTPTKPEESPVAGEPATPPLYAADDPSGKVAEAVDGLLKETESTPIDTTSNDTEKDKPKGYVADSGTTESQSMIHTKRIEPITDSSARQVPDIHELLAREGDVGAAKPPISSVISPGTGGSVNAAPVDNTPQVNPNADTPPEPTSTIKPTNPAPNSDITL